MQAVSPTGLPIMGTKDIIVGLNLIAEGTYTTGSKDLNGRPMFDFQRGGETQIDWDTQETVRRPDGFGDPRRVFIDTAYSEWTEDQLRLVPDAAEAEAMMPLDEAKKIKPGDKLLVLVDGCGDVDGEDGVQEFKAGEAVTVDMAEDFGGTQGWSVTICAANGVVNVFDEADFGGWYPFAIPEGGAA